MAGRIVRTGELAFCRDCFQRQDMAALAQNAQDRRCAACGSPRILAHGELAELSIGHIDCDAFFAAIEKRDHPELRDKPVIIGGGRRGVVATACYTARTYGVHSAMPMFKALKACPEAVVLRPDIAKYRQVGHQVRRLMEATTPLVEPLSIDEAFLDLSGTERLHRQSPAETLARLARQIEEDLGLTVSIGLSHNKFLAKLASDLDKPRGFSVIGRAETRTFLAPLPVSKIWGVGRALQKRLRQDGIERIGQLQNREETDLARRYGEIGLRLARLARGEDQRPVHRPVAAKSLSAETTFEADLTDPEELAARLWPLCEKVAARAKAAGVYGRTITLKLKTDRFRTLTRRRTLRAPTQMAEILFQQARPLLDAEADGRTAWRLLGVGLAGLTRQPQSDQTDFLSADEARIGATERAIDLVRQRFGDKAIQKGRGLTKRS